MMPTFILCKCVSIREPDIPSGKDAKSPISYPLLYGFSRNLFAGGVASAFETGATYPLFFLYTRLQQMLPGTSTFNLIRTIHKQKGISGFYPGVDSAMTLKFFQRGVLKFPLYSFFSHFYSHNGETTTQSELMAGASTGFVEGLRNPFELTRVATSTKESPYRNMRDAFRQIYKSHGLRGFSQGWLPTSLTTMVWSGFYFGVGKHVATSLKTVFPNSQDSGWITFIAGGAGGAMAGIVSNPVEVWKSRMQTPLVLGSPTSALGFGTLRKIIQREGFRPLLGNGLVPKTGRYFLGGALLRKGYETLGAFFDETMGN